MKICAIICEYNPFHNGHLYQLKQAKQLSGCDKLLCLMSGNFVQRGETAIMDKYTRAKHAVLAGADIVIELPTVFATSNAELFSKGAISILNQIPNVTTLCFGCETADKEMFLTTAKQMLNEPPSVSLEIKRLTSKGIGFAKARTTAWGNLIDTTLLSSPNNVLGLEYTKAILASHSSIQILPLKRIGGGYLDEDLKENFSSATSIRLGLENKQAIQGQLPSFVLDDLPTTVYNPIDLLEKHAILYKSAEQIAKVCDCEKGLENAFKKASLSSKTLAQRLTSTRYTTSRIKRIALQNLLNIEKNLIFQALTSPLYLRILSCKKQDDILSCLGNLPILARIYDEQALNGVAKEVFEIDQYAEEIYALLYPKQTNKNIFI